MKKYEVIMRFCAFMMAVSFLTACSSRETTLDVRTQQAQELAAAQTAEELGVKSVRVIPSLDWLPSFGPPIRQLETHLLNLRDNREMTQTISNIAYLYDAQLYIIFLELFDVSSQAARDALVNEQNLWLDFRMEVVTDTYQKNGTGDVASYHAADMFIAQTRERIVQLEKRLETLL